MIADDGRAAAAEADLAQARAVAATAEAMIAALNLEPGSLMQIVLSAFDDIADARAGRALCGGARDKGESARRRMKISADASRLRLTLAGRAADQGPEPDAVLAGPVNRHPIGPPSKPPSVDGAESQRPSQG